MRCPARAAGQGGSARCGPRYPGGGRTRAAGGGSSRQQPAAATSRADRAPGRGDKHRETAGRRGHPRSVGECCHLAAVVAAWGRGPEPGRRAESGCPRAGGKLESTAGIKCNRPSWIIHRVWLVSFSPNGFANPWSINGKWNLNDNESSRDKRNRVFSAFATEMQTTGLPSLRSPGSGSRQAAPRGGSASGSGAHLPAPRGPSATRLRPCTQKTISSTEARLHCAVFFPTAVLFPRKWSAWL